MNNIKIHMNWVVVLSVLSTVLTIVFFYYGCSIVTMRRLSEQFLNPEMRHIVMLTKAEVQRFLKADADNYVKQLSVQDLSARRHTEHTKYLDQVIRAAHDFTDLQKDALTKAADVGDIFFRKIMDNKIHGFDSSIIASIPWMFACTKNMMYEEGLPHTRDRIIFIDPANMVWDKMDQLASTLIHEKIHVYQRLHPKLMEDYMIYNGFKRHALKSEMPPRIRSNPDLDEWCYEYGGQACWYEYHSDNPGSITNSIVKHGITEHPNEYMAYQIAAMYNSYNS